MKLVEKIQKVRVALQNETPKMTGKNRTFEYFELEDFLPRLNALMDEYKMTAIPSFETEIATMTAYDFESDETVVIKSPMGSAKLAGCHEVQNIGAVETYQRRYLYQAMFDINAKDVLDGEFKDGKDDVKKAQQKPDNKITCDKCGCEITDTKRVKDGNEYVVPASEVKEKCGGLCMKCWLAANPPKTNEPNKPIETREV